jgi:hypothetical protein
MSKRRPSPAMIVAMIALCLGLGGSAIAASDLSKRDVKKIAKKQANKRINARESSLRVAHAATATNAENATNAGTAGVGLSPVAYATIAADGDVIEARSRGVTDANVTLELTSAFCFNNLGFQFKTAQTTPLYTGASADVTAPVAIPPDVGFIGDCAGSPNHDLEVGTVVDSAFAPAPFIIWFYN